MAGGALVAAGMVVVVMIAGCTGAAEEPTAERSAGPDLLYLRTRGGVTLLPAAGGGPAITVPQAVPSADWSTVVGAVRRGAVTQAVATHAASGRRLWMREVPDRLEVEAVSNHGTLAVLGSPDEGGYAGGRATTLVVVGQNLARPRTLRLAGNYEPEAFSADGLSLFVIQYRPATRPTSYRVRRLDLRTGAVEGVYSIDAHLQGSMRGTARVQAASPDGRRLYTLYTTRVADGPPQAFIHVLSLDELWAHCIDLPRDFATAPERATALAVGPDGRLYAANAESGTLAEIDTGRLRVVRTVPAAFDAAGGAAHAAVGPDGAVFLGRGTRLIALDLSRRPPVPSWERELDATILGLQAAGDGSRLYVGSRDGVVAIDASTGSRVGVLRSPSLGVIDQLGSTTRHVQEPRRTLECAC